MIDENIRNTILRDKYYTTPYNPEHKPLISFLISIRVLRGVDDKNSIYATFNSIIEVISNWVNNIYIENYIKDIEEKINREQNPEIKLTLRESIQPQPIEKLKVEILNKELQKMEFLINSINQ